MPLFTIPDVNVHPGRGSVMMADVSKEAVTQEAERHCSVRFVVRSF